MFDDFEGLETLLDLVVLGDEVRDVFSVVEREVEDVIAVGVG